MAEHYKDIEGWFDFEDIYLKAIERINKRGKFVEVGSWKGKSACFMGEEIKASGKQISLQCVDMFRGHFLLVESDELRKSQDSFLEEFEKNMADAGVDEIVTAIPGWSVQVAIHKFKDNTLDFIFIDASHQYNEVKKDLNAWFPKLKKNGLFAGHDYDDNHSEVKQAVDEFVKTNGLEDKFSVSNNSWMIEL